MIQNTMYDVCVLCSAALTIFVFVLSVLLIGRGIWSKWRNNNSKR